MRTLSAMSLLGLLAFIGFSTIGRADIYDYDDPQECTQCEVYEDYDEDSDPAEIVNNYNITNYVWIDINQQNQGYSNRGRVAYPPNARPYYPQPGYYGRPVCRIGRGGYWGNIFELWWGNQVFQRAPYGVIINSYWHLVRTGQCVAG